MIKNIRKLFLKLILPIYPEDLSLRNAICKWFLIGLLIRLLFMPFVVHADFLSVYMRAHLIISHQLPLIGRAQMLIHAFHSFFLWIFKPLLPYVDIMLDGSANHLTFNWEMFYKFVTHPAVFRTLFLLKLPYLFFDLACVYLILAIFHNRKKKLYAFKFWMLNPIIIFATYIFGRYECIAIFFILLSLYYAKRKSFIKSLLFLGISIITRS